MSRELPSNIVLFVLRAMVGVNIALLHGWDKLHHFSSRIGSVPDQLNIGSKYALMIAIAGEFVGGILMATGLLGRFGAFLVAFVSALALAATYHGSAWHERELWGLYLAGSLTVLLLGGGRYSLDSVVWKKLGKGGGAKSAPPKK
jgi:putative oxidoreductase